jgi:hypothetical protein
MLVAPLPRLQQPDQPHVAVVALHGQLLLRLKE